jgi:hypothetical protein
MSDVRKFWLKIMVITVMGVGAMHSLVGCIEVGGSTSGVDVCTGDTTECGDNHDESDASTTTTTN